jgi:hypothetical protein
VNHRAKRSLVAGAARRYSRPMASDARWPRARWFIALAGLTLAATTAGMLTFAATTGAEPGIDAAGIALIVWIMAGLPIFLGVAAWLLRAPGSAFAVGWVAFAVDMFMVLVLATELLPAVHDGPRMLAGGVVRGTVEEVSAQPRAAWAEISPATVWTAHVGTGTTSSMDKDGHVRSKSTSAAPIVPETPWTGETALFVCDDADDLGDADRGTGTIAGRVTPAGGTAADAIRSLATGHGFRVGPAPRCVTPTLGDAGTTLALGLVAAGLYTLTVALAGAWALTRTARG